VEAQLILGLCDRFGALPSAVRAEEAGVLRLLEVARLGTPEAVAGGG
jgi:hypothetical protein